MESVTSGCLLIADITGYTAYLSASELEHAQDTLASLLELLIEHTRPPLILSRLAGDAVISYALRDSFLVGQTFLEMLEETYVAFRRMIELMTLNNTCRCTACANVGTLDLKFFVHYGRFGRQRLGGHDELVGSDVNLLHRLLKNHVVEETGVRAYTLFTEAAIAALQLDAIAEDMQRLREQYEHLGDVEIRVLDMTPVWEQRRDDVHVPFPSDRVLLSVSADIAATPAEVWDYLAVPEHRRLLIGSDRQVPTRMRNGRIGEGTVFQCYHGRKLNLSTVLEWRPFERLLTQDLVSLPLGVRTISLLEYRLESIDDQITRLTQAVAAATGALPGRFFFNIAGKMLAGQFQQHIDAFRDRVEIDLAERRGASEDHDGVPL